MKFFEFNKCEYYALIGAETEEKAIEFYEEIVANIENNDQKPTEISRFRAKEKLMFKIENWNDKIKAHQEFTEMAEKSEPYLVLIDSSLV